ncbi:hypothetical protein V3331_02585 [Gaopeijia maritima]|uniref:hypothetical protein n=1 Tax=Gaopeijia maritima TaxID=3119007 RepID=UPI00324F0C77
MSDTRRPARVLTAALIALTAGACTSVTGLDPDPEPEPEPEPQPQIVWDVDLTTRYIKVLGTCDETIFGNSANGEFQYMYRVSGPGTARTRSSSDYNSPFGASYSRARGELIDFTNRTYTWRGLSSDARLEVRLWGSEWDGPTKDDAMKNIDKTGRVVFEPGKTTRSVRLGAGSCRIELVYDVTWLERQISG